jgi:hypothetical protein
MRTSQLRQKPDISTWPKHLLNHDGRVLDDRWKGWKVAGGEIFDSVGNRTTIPQLENYAAFTVHGADSIMFGMTPLE